ncbi:hypothetical protein [Agrobacterium rubi]|uniref:Uncharacterized protein n=1 Tax=Agrobacterium rubi TaxID=28099 RepID=A0AAE7RBV9_9HYPH|nr:hypothetical protein [Agrobacterium rubi]MBP1881711.1 hypothetical protein [Agrobacterium rubi]NTE87503.1 hypothetical protein [Agrobacterium rubi]NTF03357.1 hypothetical protein [Agrobacterium rubi]NTF09726.1 hypothetical protein [Agrobacterium rubi]NTF22097.1 hypothetical protein [Agrobacterium rubi]
MKKKLLLAWKQICHWLADAGSAHCGYQIDDVQKPLKKFAPRCVADPK